MESKNAKTNSLFLELTEELLQRLGEFETQLETDVKLQENSKNTYKILLVEDFIVVCKKKQEAEGVVAVIQLNFQMKLSMIETADFVTDDSEGMTQKMMLKGFRLSNGGKERISFFIRPESMAHLWIRCLSRYVNMLNWETQFKPTRILGKGSSATVYECIRSRDGAKFATKVYLKDEFNKNQKKFLAFKNQLKIIRELDSQHFFNFDGLYEDQTYYYLVMERLCGRSLFKFLTKKTSPLKTEQVMSIMKSLMVNLAELQKLNIVHRDVKLENLVFRGKDNKQLMLIDYGFAVHTDDKDYLYYKCGTPGYISPEIFKNEKDEKLTPKSDVFSAGAILHVMLTGKFLFEGQEAKEMYKNNKDCKIDFDQPQYKDLDPSAMDLMKKMLAVKPEQRLSASQCLKHEFLCQKVVQTQSKTRKDSASTQNEQPLEILTI